MPLDVEHQLDNARKLASIDIGRPREASLRRAVSTAYYALFQALCAVCADKLVGTSKPWEAYTPIFRALDHGPAGEKLKQLSVLEIPGLQAVSTAFGELKAAREWADYNPEPRPRYVLGANESPFTRGEALALIELSDRAIAVLRAFDDPTCLRLAARLVGKTKR